MNFHTMQKGLQRLKRNSIKQIVEPIQKKSIKKVVAKKAPKKINTTPKQKIVIIHKIKK